MRRPSFTVERLIGDTLRDFHRICSVYRRCETLGSGDAREPATGDGACASAEVVLL